jgi:hypothetical protein
MSRADEKKIPSSFAKMDSRVLLIHVPKTAGTSVSHVLHAAGVKYKELHFTGRLECEPWQFLDNILADPERKVILTWRNPVEHVWSTFHFYQEHSRFGAPKTFKEFVTHPAFCNQQTAFLVKKHFLSAPKLDEAVIAKVKALINRPNTLCFIQDCFDESLMRLAHFLGLSSIEFKSRTTRFNFNKPRTISAEHIKQIRENNGIDISMYHFMGGGSTKTEHRLPEKVPYCYPLNMIASHDVVLKYETRLREIHEELWSNRPEWQADLYISEWLHRFVRTCDIASLEELEKCFEADKKMFLPTGI